MHSLLAMHGAWVLSGSVHRDDHDRAVLLGFQGGAFGGAGDLRDDDLRQAVLRHGEDLRAEGGTQAAADAAGTIDKGVQKNPSFRPLVWTAGGDLYQRSWKFLGKTYAHPSRLLPVS